ncbi:TPA: hypothetical protein NJ328_003389 [Vibrio parahaemolyticus]|uniref:hypothetical protein n=2 Tax=Vibrio parahaemolyticus TaxID=670 RepID=UPI00031A11C9|nr:hypothetical protein [Vibrio parahaemolyticus]EGQ8804384.1 hypothetical protein [Vibrio parahaemolyticus]EGQ8888630.1 hypothetical protein [Vibrio parahaemolyticus]EGQ8963651.1 hypothetical protein [Vibrio parahaemolyticus]EGR1342638.1 hypothetical protein [Vibrio parahaemolyticus]EGR2853622.1 hypothetical protein [Vibrio parahaemolyticus]
MSYSEITCAIKQYAEAYKRLQELQETEPSIPEGDQKTGSIGEFYSYRYLSIAFPDSQLIYGSHSEKGWDICVSGIELKVQVKTVSAYSKTRTISPLHKGWDVLHIIYVNKALQPEGFWIIEDNSFFGDKSLLTSKKCRHPSNPNLLGSKDIPFGKNRIDELLQAL